MMRLPGGTDMTELEALKERVRILEQRDRRFRNVGIGLALSVVASFAFAQQRQGTAPPPQIPDVIQAKKFVAEEFQVVIKGDEYGYLDRNGLVLYKTAPPVQRRGPFTWTNSEYFKLFDENGIERAVLGTTGLQNTRTSAVTTRPASSLTLFDKEGKVLFRAP
jgi:hypothetical protein